MDKGKNDQCQRITEADFRRFKEDERIVDVNDLTIGCDQYVYCFTSDKNVSYILKRPKSEPIKIFNEVFALEKIKSEENITIPVPTMLYNDEDLLIESFIEGKHIIECEVSQDCIEELGGYVKQLHSIVLEGYGNINSDGKGECLTEKDYLPYCIDLSDSSFKNNKNFQGIDIPKFIEDNINYLDSKTSVLLHGDLQMQNILISNGRVSGIIDFSDITAGAPEYDLAMYYVNLQSASTWNHFLNGYGNNFNNRKMFYYVFILGTWLLSLESPKSPIWHKNFLYAYNYLHNTSK